MDYRDPVWTVVDDIDGLLDATPQTWARGEHTVWAVAGPAGEALREQLQANARAVGERVSRLLGA